METKMQKAILVALIVLLIARLISEILVIHQCHLEEADQRDPLVRYWA
jgi:hypothetical protein